MSRARLPGARAPIAGNEPATPQFYRFLAALETLQDGNPTTADIAAINAQLVALREEIDALPQGAGYPILRVLAPLMSDGLLQNGFAQLRWGGTTSDVPEGSNLYYTAARLWAALKVALVAGSNITLTPDDGAQTITVAANGGVLPVVTGEIVSGQPVFAYLDDGSLVYAEAA